MKSIQKEQLNNTNKLAPNEQVEEVVFPDVFAIKKLVEKILENLPAS